MIKKWHIWEFPENIIRVKFNDNQKFLEESIYHFKSIKNMAKILSVNPSTIIGWREYKLYLPLKYVKIIVKVRNLDWNELEKKIISYKGPNLSLIVTNPKLPIIESPKLFAIIAHLIGDGCVNKNGIPIYTNSCKTLIDHFSILIKSVFGDIDYKLYKREDNYNYRTSKVLSDLLIHFYNLDCNSLTGIFPNSINKLPKENTISLIKAFFDDEATVDPNYRITLCIRNYRLLKSIRKLLIKKLDFKNISPILKKSKNSEKDFYISIYSADLEKYSKIIGFNHPEKLNDLKSILNSKIKSNGLRKKQYQTQIELLKFLSIKPMSTKELAFALKITKSNILLAVKKLKKRGLITIHNKDSQIIKWSIMEV